MRTINVKFTCAILTILLSIPYVENYASVLNNERDLQRQEFIKKGKHNLELNLSIGQNISLVEDQLSSTSKKKVYTRTGEVFLAQPNKEQVFYLFPNLTDQKVKKIAPAEVIEIGDSSVYEGITDQLGGNALIDLDDFNSIIYLGVSIPAQMNFNYVFNRRFKIGLGGELTLNMYFKNWSEDLAKSLNKYELKKFIPNDCKIIKQFKNFNSKKWLSIDYKAFLNLGYKLFDYNLYSVWIDYRSGFSRKLGNKFFGAYLYEGYMWYLGVTLEKYLSENTKIFYKIGSQITLYNDSEPFEKECKAIFKIKDWSIFNFSFGFSFGTNDGKYKDYMYQKSEYDYYIDKYKRTFDYYNEYNSDEE